MKDRISLISKENPKMGIKRGDLVVVLSGKYKGVKGRVLKAFPKDQKVVVEKVNFIKRHTKPNRTNPQGGIIEKEAPIQVSNVMIFNEKIGTVTRAVYKTGPDGKRIRVCAKTGDEL
jgi:large subunit ribosomal protein L24